MCGIAGYVQTEANPPLNVIDRQLRLLDHRGPDSYGTFTGTRAVIGQTRLAIIDLLTGDPPIHNEDRSVGVALNGEIYNYKSVRADLVAQGHQLRTDGDTEVIAHLAENLDPVDVARRLHGMFAFAVWDERRERLILGRDRLGKKPLYYWHSGASFVFASELNALLAHPEVPRHIDAAAIPGYLTFGYVSSPRTFFEGIFSVPPGHVLVVDRDMRVMIKPYWEPKVPGASDVMPLNIPFTDVVSRVRHELTNAVERRLVSDVPVGAFLSGGVDSSAVVGIMAGLVDCPVRTFTIGFDDTEGFDERKFARRIAARFKTDHTEFVVSPEAVGLAEKLVWHYGQPFGDPSAIPTFALSELTRDHVTVALSGDGGDELFGGYERFAAALWHERLQRIPTMTPAAGFLARLLRPEALRGRGASLQRFASGLKLPLIDAFREWVSYVPEDLARNLVRQWSERAINDYRTVWAATSGADTLDRLLDLNVRTYLLDDLLPKVDRMSMAHGLEIRSPFLDHELAELAFRLTRQARIKRWTLKRVLKAAVSDLLPNDILGRRKRGFGVPLDRWFRSDLRSYVEATVVAPSASINEFLRPESVKSLVAEHTRGVRNHGQTLWTLLTLEVFLRQER